MWLTFAHSPSPISPSTLQRVAPWRARYILKEGNMIITIELDSSNPDDVEAIRWFRSYQGPESAEPPTEKKAPKKRSAKVKAEEPEVEKPVEPEVEEPTLDSVRRAITQLTGLKGRDATVVVMEQVGAVDAEGIARMSLIPVTSYGTLLGLLKAELDG
jgi:hypothetical protein